MKTGRRKLIWDKWIAISTLIGNVQMTIILWIIYIFLLTPMGLFFTIFKDPLQLKKHTNSNWTQRQKIRDKNDFFNKQG